MRYFPYSLYGAAILVDDVNTIGLVENCKRHNSTRAPLALTRTSREAFQISNWILEMDIIIAR